MVDCADSQKIASLGNPPRTSLEDFREWSRGLYYTLADLIKLRNKLDDSLIGFVFNYAGTTGNIPAGFLMCYGQPISRKKYEKLFERLGVRHGSGDNFTTFNLPDIRDRALIGLGNMGKVDANRIAVGDSTTVGAKGGSDLTALTIATMPLHLHRLLKGVGSASSPTFSDSSNWEDTWGANKLAEPAAGNAVHNNTFRAIVEEIGSGTAIGKIPPYAIAIKLIYTGVI